MTEFLSPHRLIRAFLKQPVDRTPIWLMRQAGRYLPEYRAIRKNAPDFMQLCKTPDLACEITLQPLQRFDLDGAIIFSDILTIPDAMGLGLRFVQNEGPQFLYPIKNYSDIQQLPIPDPETELRYVTDAVRKVKSALKNTLPLIGFSGSPWTLAAYMIEGKSSSNFSLAKKMLYETPVYLENLLEKLSQAIILYLNAQIDAGVDAVMIFDTWGGLLSTQDYQHFSLSYIKKIIAKLAVNKNNQAYKNKIPVILFTKYGGQWLKQMLDTQCDVIGLDWTTSLATAREQVGHAVALQGNLDPVMLYASPTRIEKEVENILAQFGHHKGHVFNLGHGIPQDIPVENVSALVTAVHRLSQKYHA